MAKANSGLAMGTTVWPVIIVVRTGVEAEGCVPAINALNAAAVPFGTDGPPTLRAPGAVGSVWGVGGIGLIAQNPMQIPCKIRASKKIRG